MSAASLSELQAAPATSSRTLDGFTVLPDYQIMRRNGAVVPFEPAKITTAIMKAFLAVHGSQGSASASVREVVENLTHTVVRALMRSRPSGGTFHIEDVQDQVELGLMRGGNHEVARAYVLYRERRNQERAQLQAQHTPAHASLHVQDRGQPVLLDVKNSMTALRPHARGWARTSIQPRSSARPCAISTTAFRWTRCSRHRSWQRAP